MANEQYDLFETEEGKEDSRSYLEMLASTCGHISSFGPCELEEAAGEPFPYVRIGNFRRKELHIRVISEAGGCDGYVNWKGKNVFSWSEHNDEIWRCEGLPACGDMTDDECQQNCELISTHSFNSRIYIPGAWENLIDELYDESMSGSLASD